MKNLLLLLFVLTLTSSFSLFAQETGRVEVVKKEEVKMLVYPNPIVDGVFTVKSTKPFMKVEVLNVIGREIYRQARINDNEVKISLLNYTKGIHFVKLTFKDRKSRVKKILLR